MNILAYITLRATGLTYILYAMASRTSDAIYAVWTIDGKPTHCTCKDRKYRPWKLCDHMKEWQKQQAPAHEGEGTLPQEMRQRFYQWKQQNEADQIDAEYNATMPKHIDDVPAPEFPSELLPFAVHGSLPGDDGEPY